MPFENIIMVDIDINIVESMGKNGGCNLNCVKACS